MKDVELYAAIAAERILFLSVLNCYFVLSDVKPKLSWFVMLSVKPMLPVYVRVLCFLSVI